MQNLGKVIKSLSDKRTYKAFRLQNELECLVVSDEDAQKSSAALSVGVGSFLDPIETQGLAHYLEHMLFMGTKKYPDQNEYSSFLTKNAGSSNAYTDQNETNYHFEVSHDAFLDSLDRFAQFFIAPLMLDSSSEKELNAVHSEHSKNLNNDMWRKYQLSKHLAKAGHPYNKFSTGDKTTLQSPNLRQMLFNFYDSNYSANLMKLVVYGKQDVESLTHSVENFFESVPNKKYKRFILNEPPFDQKIFNKIVKIIPVKDQKVLLLNWILKSKEHLYRSPPSSYVSHLVGHEGKGSLLSFLIAEGLASGLSSSGKDNYGCYSEFNIEITLTEKGLENVQQVIVSVFNEIELLKKSKPQKWVVEQIQKVNKMKFDFMEKRQGANFCSGVAKYLQSRKLEEVIIYPYLMEEFREQDISAYLEELTTQNLITMVSARKYQAQCTSVEPIYGTKFTVEDLAELPKAACSVALPEKNLFIPENLEILPMGEAHLPIELYASERTQCFFKADHQFQLPKMSLNLRLYFDGKASAREEVICALFHRMLKQNMRELVYGAEMANLNSSFSFDSYYTFTIKVDGFRDSLDRFLGPYLREILQFKVKDQNLFENIKEKLKKEYANFFLNDPYNIAYNTIFNAMKEGSGVDYKDKLREVSNVTIDEVAAYGQTWKKRIFVEMYITGNMLSSHAERVTKDIDQIVAEYSEVLPKASIGVVRAVNLPLEKVCIIEEQLKSENETNSSIIVHFQHREFDLRTRVLQNLAQTFVKEPAFDYLRTKQQLGYIVMSLPDDHRGVLGMSILVQSNIKNSYELKTYVDTFINTILKKKIEQLNEKEFEVFKGALLSTKMQKDKTLSAEANRFWTQIVQHSYDFSRKQKEVALIPTITLEEFKAFLSTIFYLNKRVLEMHTVSPKSVLEVNQLRAARKENEPNMWVFTDINSFKKRMQLFPDFYSHL